MINIDNLLNPQALKLSKIHINDLLYQFDRLHPDGYWRRYCVMAVFAAVKVDYVPVGKFPDFKYIQAWANMLNFLADNNIWDYGSFVGFNAIELGSLNLNPTIKSWALCSYIFPSRDFVDLDPVSDLNKRLNAAIGWDDVFMTEGTLGAANWTKCPFMQQNKNITGYNGKCPKCSAPAYIGFNMVDCMMGCK